MKYILLYSLFIISIKSAYGQIVSINGGDWNNPSNWSGCGGCVPNSTSQNVIINHSMSLNPPLTNISVQNLTINSGGRLMINGPTLNVGGDFSSTGNNNIPLMLNGTSRLNVAGNFISNSTGTLRNTTQANGTSIIDIGGDLIFNAATSGATGVTRNVFNTNNDATLIMRGNLVNNGMGRLEMYNNSRLTMAGSVAQTIPSLTDSWRTIPNLVVANTSGIPVNLGSSWNGDYNFNVVQAIDLQDGVVATGSSISNCSSNPRLTIGSTAVVTSNPDSYFTGGIGKLGTADFSLPLGDGSNYSSIGMSNISGGDASTLMLMQYVGSPPGNGTVTDGNIQNASGAEHWEMLNCGTPVTSSDITFGWEDACFSEIYDVSTGASQDLYMAYWDGSQWNQAPSIIEPGSQACVEGGPPESGAITMLGVSSFGKMTYASMLGMNTLPLEFVSVKSHVKNGTVLLEWETATEYNNDYFAIERSQDAKEFIVIGKVSGKNQTEAISHYEFTDNSPFKGNNYYRVKQVDFDGSHSYSQMVFAYMSVSDHLKLFPNPVKHNSSISLSEPTRVTITNASNQVIFNTTGLDVIDLSGYAPGVYFVFAEGFSPTKLIIE